MLETEVETYWVQQYRDTKPELGATGLWLGGTHDNITNTWKWRGPYENTVIINFNWSPGEPSRFNEGCIAMRAAYYGHKWKDADCDIKDYFLCEK